MPTLSRSHFPLSLLIIAMLGTILAAFGAYRWTVQRNSALAEQELSNRAQFLGKLLAAGVRAGDRKLVQHELELHSSGDQQIFLTDDYGIVTAASRATLIGHSITEVMDDLAQWHLIAASQRATRGLRAVAHAAAGGGMGSETWAVGDEAHEQLLVLHPIALPPVEGGAADRTGFLLLLKDLTRHHAEVLQQVILQSYLAAFFLVMSAAYYYVLGRRRRTERVRRLVDAAGRVARGDFSVRIRGRGEGELEQVCRAFDEMAAKLQVSREALQANEVGLAGILDTVASAIISADQSQRIVLFNRRAEQIFGYSAAEVLGKPIGLLMPERFRSEHEKALRSFGSGADLLRTSMRRPDIRGLRKSGEEFPVEASISKAVIRGRMLFTVALDDVTERRRAEQVLQQIAAGVSSHVGEDFFRELVRHLALVFDAEYAFIGRLSDSSGQRVSTLAFWEDGGYGENFSYEMTGAPCAMVVGKQTRTYAARLTDEFPGDARLIKMDANAYMGTPLSSAAGEPLGLLAVLSRQSFQQPERLEGVLEIFAARASAELERQLAVEALARGADSLEQQVAERTAHLVAVNRELEAFCQAASNDLREPLRAIDGFSQALLEDHAHQLDEAGRDYLERVRRAAQRMDRFLLDLLGLSRVTYRELHREVVDLSMLASIAVQKLTKRDPERIVKVHIAPSLTAHGDRRLLGILMDNLFDNAWKYTREVADATIELGSRMGDEGLVYYVRDNGVGFEMKYAERLFQPLHLLEMLSGDGIGLATVARIISRHGGRVWAQGKPKEGASVFFTLAPPMAARAQAMRIRSAGAKS